MIIGLYSIQRYLTTILNVTFLYLASCVNHSHLTSNCSIDVADSLLKTLAITPLVFHTRLNIFLSTKYSHRNTCSHPQHPRLLNLNTIQHSRLTISLSYYPDIRLTLCLFISWFREHRFCGLFSNFEFAITLTVANRLLLNSLRPTHNPTFYILILY